MKITIIHTFAALLSILNPFENTRMCFFVSDGRGALAIRFLIQPRGDRRRRDLKQFRCGFHSVFFRIFVNLHFLFRWDEFVRTANSFLCRSVDFPFTFVAAAGIAVVRKIQLQICHDIWGWWRGRRGQLNVGQSGRRSCERRRNGEERTLMKRKEETPEGKFTQRFRRFVRLSFDFQCGRRCIRWWIARIELGKNSHEILIENVERTFDRWERREANGVSDLQRSYSHRRCNRSVRFSDGSDCLMSLWPSLTPTSRWIESFWSRLNVRSSKECVTTMAEEDGEEEEKENYLSKPVAPNFSSLDRWGKKLGDDLDLFSRSRTPVRLRCCSLSDRDKDRKKISNGVRRRRRSSIGYGYLFHDSEMNDRRESLCVCVSRNSRMKRKRRQTEREREREGKKKKERRRRTFFFFVYFLSKCSIRLLFI